MDLYFVGAFSNWNDAANWSAFSGGGGGAGVPGVGDNAIFDSMSGSCTVDVAVVVDNIIADSFGGFAGTLDFNGYNVTCGDLRFENGSITMVGMGGSAVTVSGNLTLTCENVGLTSGILSVAGDVDINPFMSFAHNLGTLRLNNAVPRNFFCSYPLYNLEKSGAGTTSCLSALSLDANLTLSAGVCNLGTNGMTVVGNITINGGTLDLSGTSAPSECRGNVVISAGSLLASASLPMTLKGNLTVSGTGVFTHNNGTIYFQPTGAQTLNMNGQSLYDVFPGPGVSLTLANHLSCRRIQTAGAVAFNCATFNLTLSSDIQLDAGTFNAGTGILSTPSYTQAGAGCVATLTNATVNVAGSFVVATGVCNAPSGVLSAYDFQVSAPPTFAHNNGTVRLNPPAGAHIIVSNKTLYNLDIAAGGGATVQVSTVNPVLANDLTVSSGTLDFNGRSATIGGSFSSVSTVSGSSGAITVAKDVIVNGGAFTSTSGTLTVGRDFGVPAGSFAHNGGTLKMTGSFSLSATVSTNASSLNNLLIVAPGAEVFLGNNTICVGSATVTSGILNLNQKTITITGALSVTGTLRLVGNETITAASKTFQVGSTVQYYNAGIQADFANLGVTNFSNLALAAGKSHKFEAGKTYLVAGVLSGNNATIVTPSGGGPPPVPVPPIPGPLPSAPAISVTRQFPENHSLLNQAFTLQPAMLSAFNKVGDWGLMVGAASYPLNMYFVNSVSGAPAIGQTIEFRAAIPAGAYTFRILAPTGPDCGIVDVYVNDFLVASAVDLYAATADPGNVITVYKIMADSAIQRIRFAVTGKNGASSNFFFRMVSMQLQPFQVGVI